MFRTNYDKIIGFVETLSEKCKDSFILKGALALNVTLMEKNNDINHRFLEDFDT